MIFFACIPSVIRKNKSNVKAMLTFTFRFRVHLHCSEFIVRYQRIEYIWPVTCNLTVKTPQIVLQNECNEYLLATL